MLDLTRFVRSEWRTRQGRAEALDALAAIIASSALAIALGALAISLVP